MRVEKSRACSEDQSCHSSQAGADRLRSHIRDYLLAKGPATLPCSTHAGALTATTVPCQHPGAESGARASHGLNVAMIVTTSVSTPCAALFLLPTVYLRPRRELACRTSDEAILFRSCLSAWVKAWAVEGHTRVMGGSTHHLKMWFGRRQRAPESLRYEGPFTKPLGTARVHVYAVLSG